VHRVSAVILAYYRRDTVAEVLGLLDDLDSIDEVIVVDNGDDGTDELVRSWGGKVRLVDPGSNVGIAGRNLGAREATGDLVVFLDDDSYPLPGAVEALRELFDRMPRLAVAGGFVRDVDAAKNVVVDTQVGSFDWWLRGGAKGDAPADGFPAFFFPEGACMVRRQTFLDIGGFFEPFFFGSTEIDLTTRLLGAGWDVRYLPTAPFDHMKVPAGRASFHDVLQLRIRNQLWYFWMHFPATLAVRRMATYAVFDLLNAVHRKVIPSWQRGIAAAWRERDAVRAYRNPLPRHVLRRAEGRRFRMHVELVLTRLSERIRARR
jgi:GT2 family glycosyltransferase